MRIGLQLPSFTFPGGTPEIRGRLTEIAQAAEDAELVVEVDLRDGRMSTSDVVAMARAQAAAGVQHLIVNMPDVWDLRHVERIRREVVPALSELAA